jgi:hypothetical protein
MRHSSGALSLGRQASTPQFILHCTNEAIFQVICKFEEVKIRRMEGWIVGEVCLLFFPSKGAH